MQSVISTSETLFFALLMLFGWALVVMAHPPSRWRS